MNASQLTPEQITNANLKKASEDLQDIEELLANKVFRRYYLRRVGEQLDRQRERVLSCSMDDLLAERRKLDAMKEAFAFMEGDRLGCRSILGALE